MSGRMKFGVFHPPLHAPTGRNPQRLLQQDVELVKHLDRLGYDEIWIGEHHSCGTEIIADPLLFCAYAAPLTTNIDLCAGVVSLPYHNPLWVADRMILVDHLTRGRVKLGLGPGALTTDAYMIGLDQTTQREALEEDTGVLLQLLRGEEPVTITTARYTLQEARVQVAPYSDFEIALSASASPTGALIAGKHGLSLLSHGATLAAHSKSKVDKLALMWNAYAERCEQFGNTPDRSGWRLVGPMHIAETREAAIEQVRHGIDAGFDYFQNIIAATHFRVEGTTTEERIAFVIESGMGVIGTPDDAIAQIEHLIAQSKGGFGAYLFLAHEWANFANTIHSYELFAEYVMPHFQGLRQPLIDNANWSREVRDVLGRDQAENVQAAIARHEAEQAARKEPAGSAS